MKNLHEITRAILTHEKEEFDKTFTPPQIKELDERIDIDPKGYNYIEPDFTKYTYAAFDKFWIDDIWYDATIDLVDECYLNNVLRYIKNYFNYDKFFDDCKMNGSRVEQFNSYDGNTELETDNYFIYYHNQN